MMKLTKREKKLITILLVLITLIAYYKLILQPPLNKIELMNEDKEDKKFKAEQIMSQLKLKEKISEEYKILGYKINNIASRYFSEINQERIILVLDNMLEESGLRESSISFSDINIKDVSTIEETKKQEATLHELARKINDDALEREKKGEENKKSSEENIDKSPQVEGMTVIINYEGSYNQLLKFLSLIEKNEDKIVISSLNTVMNEAVLQGSIILEFHAIPNVSNMDDEIIEWDFYENYGKDNPFSVLSDLSGNITKKEDAAKTQSDFIMIVKPLSSDLPALTLGKNKDRVGETCIYADNSRIEDINIYFHEKDDVLYYKYKSEKSLYPDDFNKWVQFTPFGKEIKIKVYSEKRNSLQDISGVNMIINNATNYKVLVNISNDDIKRPRIYVVKEKGKIEVINN